MPTARTLAFGLFAVAALIGTPAVAADTMLSATLVGGSETQPADPNGSGAFMAHIDPGTGRLCYTLTSKNLDTLTMAHIHAGAVGVAGPVVVAVSPDVPTTTCITVDKDIAAKLIASPADYYVNIHTAKYPKGAIRGQLSQ